MALDFGAPSGTPILAVAAGTVVDEGINDHYSGNWIGIDHREGWHSVYRHLLNPSPLSPGRKVVQGQVVGQVGSTGVSTGPHLHFDLWCKVKHSPEAIWKNGWWAHDPKLYLKEVDMGMTPEERTILRKIEETVTSNSKRRVYIANYEQLQGECAEVVAQANYAFSQAMNLGQVGLMSSFDSVVGETEGSLEDIRTKIDAALTRINNSKAGMKVEAHRGDYGLVER